ncbi:anaerobic ribonucleoside-triphosphate reductase activating protein [Hungatella hathewayi]|uniref:anaerobic ribonucleoside-triphosphate reductase activating protein n=1 Tax=Hungatella hathewayi TaxID=154046 RepID=UPI003561FC3C
MNYHDIKKCNMLNGEGLRCVLFVSGCSHRCEGCHNPETWNPESGIPFDKKAWDEIVNELEKDYISGLTLSGGDPLNEANLDDILNIVKFSKMLFPDKTIWIYTGYTYNDLQKDSSKNGKKRKEILEYCDVLVDGKFEQNLMSEEYPFAGSTNQRVIKQK